MNNYKNIKAKVLRIDEEEHKFVIEVENRIYKVGQIDFQRRQPAPKTLDCLMITTHLGKVFISQNIEHLMRKHYKENDEVDFKIKMTLGDFYHLEDEYGFTAMLKRDTIINAALTPRVRCRVMKFRQKYMEVQLVEVLGADKSEFSLSDKDFREIIGDENWNTPEFRNLMLGDTPSDIFDLECHRWIAGTVSYTHLDVYKRQGQPFSMMPTTRDIHTSSDLRWMPPSATRIVWERIRTASSSCSPIPHSLASRLPMVVWMPSDLPKKSMPSNSSLRRVSRQRVSA